MQYFNIVRKEPAIAYDPGVIPGIPPAVGNEVVRTARIDLVPLSSAFGTESDTLAPVSVRKSDMGEHLPSHKKRSPLNQGNKAIGHIEITVQEQLSALETHKVSPFTGYIGFRFEQISHAAL
jgi:hypothetical protein